MGKRNIISELTGGSNALHAEREGKLTLCRVHMEAKPVPPLTPKKVLAGREKQHLSRPMLARYLRTLENWEQRRAKTNAQAVLLICIVAQFPDMAEQLEAV